MQQPQDAGKVTANAEPRWVGPLALLTGFAAYMIIFGILTGEIPNPLEARGEGILITLIFYFPVRAAFHMALVIKLKKRTRRRKPHEL